MSSSYELTSLHSITLSSCSVSAAALLGDINIQLQKLSNQIKFLLQFIPMTFVGGRRGMGGTTVSEQNQNAIASIT